MAHYAKVVGGLVVEVIVAEADFFNTFVDDTPGEWIQTSYNTHENVHALGETPLRKNFAGIGYEYHVDIDAFVAPKNSETDVLNTETGVYEPAV